jgi:hypothetical protein
MAVCVVGAFQRPRAASSPSICISLFPLKMLRGGIVQTSVAMEKGRTVGDDQNVEMVTQGLGYRV